MNTKQFIEKAIIIHGDNYDYSLVEYVNSKMNVKIICKQHGLFEQRTSHHTSGHGCKKCSSAETSKRIKQHTVKAKGKYIDRINKVHNNKYKYPNFNPNLTTDKIKIICPIHGDFEQVLTNHLSGRGCHLCGNILISKAKENSARNNKQDFSHITPPEGARIISLTRGKYALVDEEDYERVNQYNWSASKELNSWYTYHRFNGKIKSMHRFIIDSDAKRVDHINHNGLDNRKNNLRNCNPQQNSMNGRKHKDGSSKYKGLTWWKRDKNWRVTIGYNYKVIHLGYFTNEEEGARAYDNKAKELFGEFANLNFPEK